MKTTLFVMDRRTDGPTTSAKQYISYTYIDGRHNDSSYRLGYCKLGYC